MPRIALEEELARLRAQVPPAAGAHLGRAGPETELGHGDGNVQEQQQRLRQQLLDESKARLDAEREARQREWTHLQHAGA